MRSRRYKTYRDTQGPLLIALSAYGFGPAVSPNTSSSDNRPCWSATWKRYLLSNLLECNHTTISPNRQPGQDLRPTPKGIKAVLLIPGDVEPSFMGRNRSGMNSSEDPQNLGS